MALCARPRGLSEPDHPDGSLVVELEGRGESLGAAPLGSPV